MIIQNAILIPETGEILHSTHVHDFAMSKDQKHYTDGGNDYIRRTVGKYIELDLDHLSSMEEKYDKMLWGTYGPTGTDPFKKVFLKDCKTSHLINIYALPYLYIYAKEVIEYIFKKRISEKMNSVLFDGESQIRLVRVRKEGRVTIPKEIVDYAGFKDSVWLTKDENFTTISSDNTTLAKQFKVDSSGNIRFTTGLSENTNVAIVAQRDFIGVLLS